MPFDKSLRVFRCNRTIGRADPDRPKDVGYCGGDTYFQCGRSRSTRGGWRDGWPVQLHSPYAKALEPYAGLRFDRVEDFLDCLAGDGWHVTDYRRVVGRVDNVEDAAARLVDQIVEECADWITMLYPRVNGRHEALWRVDYNVFLDLKRFKLIRVFERLGSGQCNRISYHQGTRQFGDIADSKWGYGARTKRDVGKVPRGPNFFGYSLVIDDRLTFGPVLPAPAPEVKTPPLAEPTVSPFPSKFRAASIGAPKRAPKTSPTVVLAIDDNGNPITAMDVVREGRKNLPKGFPKDLVPTAEPDCSDAEWERLMLIEQIKFRRRQRKS